MSMSNKYILERNTDALEQYAIQYAKSVHGSGGRKREKHIRADIIYYLAEHITRVIGVCSTSDNIIFSTMYGFRKLF